MCMHRRTCTHTQIHHTTRERKNERGRERRRKEGRRKVRKVGQRNEEREEKIFRNQ